MARKMDMMTDFMLVPDPDWSTFAVFNNVSGVIVKEVLGTDFQDEEFKQTIAVWMTLIALSSA